MLEVSRETTQIFQIDLIYRTVVDNSHRFVHIGMMFIILYFYNSIELWRSKA